MVVDYTTHNFGAEQCGGTIMQKYVNIFNMTKLYLLMIFSMMAQNIISFGWEFVSVRTFLAVCTYVSMMDFRGPHFDMFIILIIMHNGNRGKDSSPSGVVNIIIILAADLIQILNPSFQSKGPFCEEDWYSFRSIVVVLSSWLGFLVLVQSNFSKVGD